MNMFYPAFTLNYCTDFAATTRQFIARFFIKAAHFHEVKIGIYIELYHYPADDNNLQLFQRPDLSARRGIYNFYPVKVSMKLIPARLVCPQL